MAIYRFEEDAPKIDPDAWVADSASVIGRVRLGAQSSVWYGCVLRGDNEWMTIGRCTNIQDLSVLHTDIGVPMTIGDNVTVGHQVMLHGCTIGDGSLIGIQSVVLNHARIGRHCLVGAGSLVPEGKEFPDGALIIGAPAKVKRMLSADEIAHIADITAGYVGNAQRHRKLQRLD